ncbi:MFS transporter [Sporobolomyces salmoneus]|uniref:MFS transporter n=1 Tax=Sporobolomyces salmoneus TaxID=183962 RepID=UPI00317DAC64
MTAPLLSHPSINRQSSRTPLIGPAKLPSPPANETSLPDEDPPSSRPPFEEVNQQESDGSDSEGSDESTWLRRGEDGGMSPLDQTLEEIGVGRYQLQLLVLCGLGWLADNMYLQAVAVILPRVQKEFEISDRWIGLLSTSIFAGMMVGAWGWGSYSDARGRLPAFNLTLCFTAVFGISSAFSPNFPTLCLALFLLGTGVGGSMPTDGTLFLENIPKTSHYLLTALSVFFSLGAIVTSLLSVVIFPRFACDSSPDANESPCDPKTQNRGWRVLLGCLGMISVVMFLARVLFFKLHESAKFLVASKRASAAVVSLQRISSFNGTNSSWGLDDVVDDVSSIKERSNGIGSVKGNEDEDVDENGSGGGEQHAYLSTRSPSLDSAASSLLHGNVDLESSIYPSSDPSDSHRARRRPEWINRLPRAWRSAATDYMSRVDELLEGKWRRTTLLIWTIWTLASAAYTMFNVFLPKFLEEKLDQGRGGTKGKVDESLKDYVLYTLAGLPGSLLGAYLVETSLGRSLTLAYSTLATSLGTFIFVFVHGQTGVVLSSMLVSLAATLMYAVIYSLTPEIFPTTLRGTAGGIASALSRLSGIVAPLLTGALLSISISLPLFLSALCFFATAVCAWNLRGIEIELKLGKNALKSASPPH